VTCHSWHFCAVPTAEQPGIKNERSGLSYKILHVGRGQPCSDEVWSLFEGNGKETGMSKSSPSISRNVQHAERGARNAVAGRWMAVLARCGYAAKGVVYLIIGA
jgi:hypothetical protein